MAKSIMTAADILFNVEGRPYEVALATARDLEKSGKVSLSIIKMHGTLIIHGSNGLVVFEKDGSAEIFN